MPRMWEFGLWVTAAMLRFAFEKAEGESERAARKDQVKARKVERRRKRAQSATDSVQAAAELQYRIPRRQRLASTELVLEGDRECTVLGHGFGVYPVEACACAGVYFAAFWEEGSRLCVSSLSKYVKLFNWDFSLFP